VNALFNKNPLWVRAQPQDTTPPNPDRFVGLYYLFQRTLVQIVTNDERDWAARASYLPQDIFGLFLKDQVATTGDPINIFRSTSRQ
jgi:hypothetical protein